MPDPQRIVLVRLSHLGDVVHALPVYHALRARYERARIVWVVQPEFAELVRPLPGLDGVVAFARRDGLRAWWRLRRALGAFAPELAVDAQGNVKSACATWLSRAPRRVGLHPDDWREPLGARVLTEHAPPTRRPPGREPHALDRMLTLAEHVGPDPARPARFDPALTESERERGRALARERLPGPRPVVVALADPADPRAWPLEHCAALARGLRDEGRGVLLLSGPAEAAHGAALERELGTSATLRHWVGQRGLRDLAAFFAAAAERGTRFVGSDSGPLHLAVASGLPVVGLAGPQSHWRTGPWPPPPLDPGPASEPGEDPRSHRHRVLRTELELDCAPCLARRCRHPDGPVCMRTLDPDRVRTALAGD